MGDRSHTLDEVDEIRLQDVIGTMFDPSDMVRSRLEMCYGVTLAQQVLADLLCKYPDLRRPEMTVQLVLNEKLNDFYSFFIQLMGMHMQLQRRYAGIRFTYVADARTIAQSYRTMCFVFRHARVHTFQSNSRSPKTQSYILDERQGDHGRVRTNADELHRHMLEYHTCRITTTSALVRERDVVLRQLQTAHLRDMDAVKISDRIAANYETVKIGWDQVNRELAAMVSRNTLTRQLSEQEKLRLQDLRDEVRQAKATAQRILDARGSWERNMDNLGAVVRSATDAVAAATCRWTQLRQKMQNVMEGSMTSIF